MVAKWTHVMDAGWGISLLRCREHFHFRNMDGNTTIAAMEINKNNMYGIYVIWYRIYWYNLYRSNQL